ncbi:transcriptional regulator [Actinocatenispora thailandica]|uniref:Transcriptional regulator n=1 Tax=Actinocatenispora thailandica TaxID=227318 RepID=A0A7R7DUY5_9ACTN|nr:helix-turn-helix transcriptional regulator [Actinocatenispora thailandica]BCJ38354.1 transcriptional regulator [Actinocatenispora thailandica]
MTTRRVSPTVPTRRVASTLRMYRERKGMGVGEAAAAVDHQSSWLSRIEGMENRPHPNDVQALLMQYDVEQPIIEAVKAVARQSRKRGWWYPYHDVLPDWFGQYLGLESDASTIRAFDGLAVPGLLQTEEYARAMVQALVTRQSSAEIDRFTRLRIERQQRITDDEDPVQFRAVLDEGLLWRQVGGRQVMIEQIERLLEVGQRPNVEIQVVPSSAGAHAGMDGSFVVMDFPPLPTPFPTIDDRIAYVDLLVGAKYFDNPAEVAPYEAVWEQLRGDALSSDESDALLRRIAKRLAAH